MGAKIDMTGWKMWEHNQPKSRWEIIEEDLNYKKEHNIKANTTYWKCKCKCGTFKTVLGQSLRNGKSLSCGCLIKETNSKNITGKKFHRLLALESTHNTHSKGNRIWLCKCECGNLCEATTTNLIRGDKKSCGCLKSNGEMIISQLLKENNIPFERQKTFEECKDNKLLPFDFYVNNNFLLEFDGKQHYKFSDIGWDTKEKYEITHKHDVIKNNFSIKNNIPLKRIPYWELKNITIEDIMGNKFLIKE